MFAIFSLKAYTQFCTCTHTHIRRERVLMNQFSVIKESGLWCVCCNKNYVGLVVT